MRNYDIPWSITTRADLVDRQLLSLLHECGCQHISFGVESGVEEIRYAAGKKIPDGRFTSAFKACRDIGIQTRAYAMLGFPGETRENMQKTFDFINSLEADEVMYSPTIAYPGTKLMEYAIRERILTPDAWGQYMLGKEGMPYFNPAGLSADYISQLCFDESKRFYLTPKQIWSRMRNAQSLDDITDSLKACVAYLAGPLFNSTT
jgi:radical SAM superfamily enzyme YgiQ (UPF0313 family)